MSDMLRVDEDPCGFYKAEIERLRARNAELVAVLKALEPHLDAIVALTRGEREYNHLIYLARVAPAKVEGQRG